MVKEMGVTQECIVLTGQKPSWKDEPNPKRDQVVYHGRFGTGRHETYSILRWEGNKTALPTTWFEGLDRDAAREFLHNGKALNHPLVGPIVSVSYAFERGEVTVRRVRWPWLFLGQWYRIRRRLLIVRDWVRFNRMWLQQNW